MSNHDPPLAVRVLLTGPRVPDRDQIGRLLTDAGFVVDPADDPAAVATLVRGALFDVALVDAVNLSGGAAAEAAIRAVDPQLPMLFLVPMGEVDRAAAALARGPQHFVAKPARRDALVSAVAAASAAGQAARRVARARPGPRFDTLLGHNPKLLAAFELGRRAAATDQPVCILGETGTGKSVLAQAIHAASPRAALPLVDEVLAGMSPDQQRDALFGHTVGAFTGADKARTGLLHDAHLSSLFLDEVADLAAEVQVSLLRFLDKGTFRPLGSNREAMANIRLIAATNADLPRMVASGRFRRDLFERFGPFAIILPPLRERPEDIPNLAAHYARHATPRGNPPPHFSPAAMARMCGYEWPGNVRQLKLVVEAAVAVADGPVIGTEHCLLRPTDGTPGSDGAVDFDLPLERYLDGCRRHYFTRLVSRSARMAEIVAHAGLHETNVRKWLRKFRLTTVDADRQQ